MVMHSLTLVVYTVIDAEFSIPSRGLMYETMRQFALAGVKVYLGARKESEGLAAIAKILAAYSEAWFLIQACIYQNRCWNYDRGARSGEIIFSNGR